MGRAPCCDKANVKRGPWSPEEDATLKAYIDQHGPVGNWIALPPKIGLKRCGKSCRLRWLNYLRPNIKHGGFSDEEDHIICTLFMTIGSRWSIIAAQLPGRTDNDIKNYWNTKLKKKLLGKQRKDQRVRPARYLKQEPDRNSEDLLINETINTYPHLHHEASHHLKNQTVNYHESLNNNLYFQYPSHISSCVEDHQLFNQNPITTTMHASSFSMNVMIKNNGVSSASPSSTTGYNNYPFINWTSTDQNRLIQGYNNTTNPGQIDEIAFNNGQNFDGFESLSGVDMVNTSTITTTTSPESASWEDISSLVYPPTASNLEVSQQLMMPNYTGYKPIW